MYITKQGQAWDEIAKEVYGSELHADYLMANNLKHIDVFIFPAGIDLATPKLPRYKSNLPPWR